ncbi:unnamed protein product, partial [Didymodactylos carnosus]
QCKYGRWSCTNHSCPRTCSVIGNGHISTFDGKQYSLLSTCEHTLVEQSDNKQLTKHLRIAYMNLGNIDKNQLTIEINKTIVVIKSHTVIINGITRSTLPFQNDDLLIRQLTLISIQDLYGTVIVHFDGLRVYITLQPSFVNQVRGLCGTYNFITNDEFLTLNGLTETNIETFANAYKTFGDCSVPDQINPCLNSPANEYSARDICSKALKDAIFSSCLTAVDPTFFIESCIKDLCVDLSANYQDQIKCSMVAAYAHECALKSIIVDWMNVDNLASSCQNINYGKCPSTVPYSECVPSCMSSCSDISLQTISVWCRCPKDEYFDQQAKVCRVKHECPCYDQTTEKYILPSRSVQTPISNCSCTHGSLLCTNLFNDKCPPTQIYSTDISTCPKTCVNRRNYVNCNVTKLGCGCPSEYILSQDQITCIREEQCPCVFGLTNYMNGEVILQGCNNCTCQAGEWICQNTDSCDKTCTVFGDSHYITFDGLKYSYPGQCQYYLVKEQTNLFSIVIQDIPCGKSGYSCSKNIIVDYKGINKTPIA